MIFLMALVGGAVVIAIGREKGWFTPKRIPDVTPEQRAANLRSRMQTALEAGNDREYLRLKEELELVELETGL